MATQSLHARYQPAWHADAACAGLDTEDFFPEPRRLIVEELFARNTTTWAALTVCYRCPVRRQCLESAFTETPSRERDTFGIFGGTTPGMRRAEYEHPDRVEVLMAMLDDLMDSYDGRSTA